MSIDACADLVARGDQDRFRSVMAAPLAARAQLLPIYAFNVEVSRAPWITEEPIIAEMRLQWWRDALEEIGAQRTVRSHAVTKELARVLSPSDAQVLDKLVAARRWDIYRDPFEDALHFHDYLDSTAAGLMWVAAKRLGAEAKNETAYRNVGWAAGLAAFFQAIPDLEARGRRPLVDGRPTAVAALAKDGLDRLARGLRHGARGPASFPAWQTGALLKKVLADPSVVGDGRLELSEFSRRARLLRTSLTGSVSL